MLQPSRKETFTMISNALGKVMAPTYSHLLPQIQQKLGSYDKGN